MSTAANERNVRIALAVGLGVLVVAVAAVLSGSSTAAIATNAVPVTTELLVTNSSTSACQTGEAIPRATSAVRLSMSSVYGPRVTVRAYSGTQTIASGERGSGWTADVVTVAVKPLARTFPHATVCFSLASTGAGVTRIDGQGVRASRAAHRSDGRPLAGRVRIEYLAPGRTWWSMASTVIQRMGFGHAGSGGWIALLAIALMSAVGAVATRLALRELR